jgi:RNA polymerase sigma-70 factor (ECF subfamily)
LTLTRSEPDACDLTQSAFEKLFAHAAKLRDASKVKSWLFTTLYRLFLEQKRHTTRFPHVELETASLPPVDSSAEEQIDSSIALAALQEVEEPFRAALALFYLEQHSYREIAEILDLPIGTVMSRLARGKALLRAALAAQTSNIVPLPLKAAV